MSRLVYIFPGIPGVGTARGPDMNQSRSRERLYQRHLVSGLFILPQVGQHLQEQKEKKKKERFITSCHSSSCATATGYKHHHHHGRRGTH